MEKISIELFSECEKLISQANFNITPGFCPPVWDELLCWPQTKAGFLLSVPCPQYFGYSPKTNVTKKCTDEGNWFYHETYQRHWTNYTECIQLIDNNTGTLPLNTSQEILDFIQWLPKIKIINYFGYGLSLTALLLSITIFIFFKKLHCARNRLHLHLFLSFTLKVIVFILKNMFFVEGIALFRDVVFDGQNTYIKEHNFWFCKAVSSLWQYLILSNYFLILMEGIYLHNLLFLTFISDKVDTMLYALFGWGLPILFITPWILVKVFYEDELCWTKYENNYFQFLIQAPIIFTVLMNFILFAKIINILLVKLNSMYIQQRKIKYKRLIRATLILTPIFGVPYIISILTWYYVTTSTTLELTWLFFDQTFTSLQGFFVALLYCLLNKEVKNELKKFLTRQSNLKNKRNSIPLYATITNRFSFTIDNDRHNNM